MSNNDNTPWVAKHRPTTWGGFQGNGAAVKRLRQWLEGFTPGDAPRLLTGPPGVGKTSLVHLLTDKYDLALTEINASNARTTSDVEEIVKDLKSGSWDGRARLVFLDEVDSWPATVRLTPLYRALKDSPTPVILACNTVYDVPYKLRNVCEEEKITLQERSRRSKLKAVAETEDVDLSEEELDILADYPDLRVAINTLQVYAESGAPLPRDLGEDRAMDNFDAVDNILRGKREVGHNITPPDLIMWLQENLRKDFRGLEAGMAYDALSRADKYEGRARRTQNYTYWRYAGELAERTADMRLTEPWEGYIQKGFPEWFRHKTPRPDDGSDVSDLYRALSGYDDAAPGGLSESYTVFRQQILPVLRALPEEEKFELCNAHNLSKDAMGALDVHPKDYGAWRVETSD